MKGSVGQRVLIIEDDPGVSRFLASSLEGGGYQVRVEGTGQGGLQAAIEFRPELIVLDLGLPDLDGQTVLHRLREWCQAPILILTARESDADKVAALDHGADDYLTKPFSVDELQARVRVAFRHAAALAPADEYVRGPFTCRLADRSVRVDGRAIALTATEFDILRVLIKHAGKVVTHRMLLKEIWGPNSVEHVQYLRVYVGQLRKKLKPADGTPLIATEAGVGYRWITD